MRWEQNSGVVNTSRALELTTPSSQATWFSSRILWCAFPVPATKIQSTLQSLKLLSEEPSLTLESADILEGQKALIWKGSLSHVSKVKVGSSFVH